VCAIPLYSGDRAHRVLFGAGLGSAGVERARYLEHVRADGKALAGAARRDPDAPVRSCPGWTEADLVGHVGRVYGWVTGIVEAGSTAPPAGDRPTPPAGAAAVGWFEERLDRLVAVLGSVDVGAPAWNWSPGPQVAGFWPRRMAQETAVHRWDGEDGAGGGAARPVDADLAVDGIDEWIAVHVATDAREPEAPVEAVTAPLGLAPSDRLSRWLARLAGREVDLTRDAAADLSSAGAGVSGPASDLLLALWGRLPTGAGRSVTVEGDPALLDAWMALADL